MPRPMQRSYPNSRQNGAKTSEKADGRSGASSSMSRALLWIDGEVERPIALTMTQLVGLPSHDLVADFHCREGWSRLHVHWRGIRLSSLLQLAGARSSGRYVTISSGTYTIVLDRDRAEDERLLVAFQRDHQPISTDEGLPRLVGPSEWDCFLSVKSIDRIEVTESPARATGPDIALARIGQAAATPALA